MSHIIFEDVCNDVGRNVGEVNEVGTNFKSLTAQKLMAGLSFNSIDTLLEVNAAAEARTKLNESTETIDFGVI